MLDECNKKSEAVSDLLKRNQLAALEGVKPRTFLSHRDVVLHGLWIFNCGSRAKRRRQNPHGFRGGIWETSSQTIIREIH